MRSDHVQSVALNGVSADFGRHLTAALPRLKRFGRKLTGSAVEGDDLVQATCHRALERQHLWQSNLPIESWLLRIMHNLWVDQIRAQNARKRMTDALGTTTFDCVDGSRAQEARLMLWAVQRASEGLPEGQRQVLNAVVVEGLSYKEAASKLKLPIGTIMSRLTRARAKLLRVALGGLFVAATSQILTTRKAAASEAGGASHLPQADKPVPMGREPSSAGQGWAEAGSAIILGWLAVGSAYGAEGAAGSEVPSGLPALDDVAEGDASGRDDGGSRPSHGGLESRSAELSTSLSTGEAGRALLSSGGAEASSLATPGASLDPAPPLPGLDGDPSGGTAASLPGTLQEPEAGRERAVDFGGIVEENGSGPLDTAVREAGPTAADSLALATSLTGLTAADSLALATSLTGLTAADSLALAASLTGPAAADSLALAASLTGPAQASSTASASSPIEASNLSSTTSGFGSAGLSAEDSAAVGIEMTPELADEALARGAAKGQAQDGGPAELGVRSGDLGGPTTALSGYVRPDLAGGEPEAAAGSLFFEEAPPDSSGDLLDLIEASESASAAEGAFVRLELPRGGQEVPWDYALMSEDSAIQTFELPEEDDPLVG